MTIFKWNLPTDLLETSVAIMRPHGAVGNEGLALWFGVPDTDGARVTYLVEVFGSGFKTGPLYMQLSYRAMSTLTDLADSLDVALVGQIHSHPGRFIDLSPLDRAQGIRSPDYLSLVCPHYAQVDTRSYLDCGVHVFENGDYRRLPTREITTRLQIIPEKVQHIRQGVKE